MKLLPKALIRVINDKRKSHSLILLLATTNLILLIVLFVAVAVPKTNLFPKVNAIAPNTPIVRFNLISPQENSTVSGTVALVTTLSNGPQIEKAKLTLNGKDIQTVFSQQTEKLTVFWDTTKVANGKYDVIITAYDNQNGASQLYTKFTVENKDIQKPIR